MSARASSGSSTNQPLVATLTLGCKLNQAETQQAARELQRHGCVTTDRPARADAYLINTCTITHVADRKARRLIRMAHRLSPDAPVIVTGCYAERDGDSLAELPQVRLVGNERKHEAATVLLDSIDGASPASNVIARSDGRTRSFIKIQEGCDDVCAFCIVPYVRGRERAVPIDELVALAQERVEEGVQEIVLTGTQPGAYGTRSNGRRVGSGADRGAVGKDGCAADSLLVDPAAGHHASVAGLLGRFAHVPATSTWRCRADRTMCSRGCVGATRRRSSARRCR